MKKFRLHNNLISINDYKVKWNANKADSFSVRIEVAQNGGFKLGLYRT